MSRTPAAKYADDRPDDDAEDYPDNRSRSRKDDHHGEDYSIRGQEIGRNEYGQDEANDRANDRAVDSVVKVIAQSPHRDISLSR